MSCRPEYELIEDNQRSAEQQRKSVFRESEVALKRAVVFVEQYERV